MNTDMPIARKLDFIVAGTGRSGTSAVTRYLSAVSSVHCGLERFHPRTDHRTLHPPACFTDLASGDLPNGNWRPASTSLQFSIDEISRRGADIRLFGNKTPNYIFRLGGLLDEIAPGRAIICWRDPRAVAESYTRRADNPKDNWPPGKRAIFAVADIMICLQALANLGQHDVMIVPNRAVVADWDGATRGMVNFLMPEHGEVSYDPVNLAVIKAQLEKSQRVPRHPSLWRPTEQRAVESLERTGIDAVMNRDSVFLLSDVVDELRAVVARLPQDIVEHTRALTEEDGGQEGIDCFLPWSKMPSFGLRQTRSALRKSG